MTLQDTPVPGSYKIGGFLDDIQKAPSTYHFRDSTRAKSASHQRYTRTGEMLIPGAYEHEDFLQESGKKALTFGFKGIEREKGPKIGHGYGDKVYMHRPWQHAQAMVMETRYTYTGHGYGDNVYIHSTCTGHGCGDKVAIHTFNMHSETCLFRLPMPDYR